MKTYFKHKYSLNFLLMFFIIIQFFLLKIQGEDE